MEIYTHGKTIYMNGQQDGAEYLIKKLAQQLNINNTNKTIEFPFDFSETSDENEYNYPADKIGGFAQIKNSLNIPGEIYVKLDDVKNIGAFVLDVLRH